jgi:hypothetical protein
MKKHSAYLIFKLGFFALLPIAILFVLSSEEDALSMVDGRRNCLSKYLQLSFGSLANQGIFLRRLYFFEELEFLEAHIRLEIEISTLFLQSQIGLPSVHTQRPPVNGVQVATLEFIAHRSSIDCFLCEMFYFFFGSCKKCSFISCLN